jgi:hypothetical protein
MANLVAEHVTARAEPLHRGGQLGRKARLPILRAAPAASAAGRTCWQCTEIAYRRSFAWRLYAGVRGVRWYKAARGKRGPRGSSTA